LLLVAAAYFRQMPTVFGKAPRGSMRPLSASLMMPYLSITWIVWWLQKSLLRESVWNEVGPGTFVGRRCRRSELPPNASTVIDCTAEFPADRESRQTLRWLSVPVWDGCAPTKEDFLRACNFVEQIPTLPVYVSCANGHGRSVTLVVALLIARRHFQTAQEAVESIKRSRPLASLNVEQWRFLEEASQRCFAARKDALPGR
jgi:protein-tyrosine phosphatase